MSLGFHAWNDKELLQSAGLHPEVCPLTPRLLTARILLSTKFVVCCGSQITLLESLMPAGS